MKKTVLFLIACSILLMIGLTQPRHIDRAMYDQSRDWIMGVSGLVGMLVIMRQVVVGLVDGGKKTSLYRGLSLGTAMSCIFHPFAALIAYGTSGLALFSLGKILIDLFLVFAVTYMISKKILYLPSSKAVDSMLYALFIAVRVHAWISGTMIAENTSIAVYRLVIGVVLFTAISVRVLSFFRKSTKKVSS